MILKLVLLSIMLKALGILHASGKNHQRNVVSIGTIIFPQETNMSMRYSTIADLIEVGHSPSM